MIYHTPWCDARGCSCEAYANRNRAECEAKRGIVELHAPMVGFPTWCATCADNEASDYDGAPIIDWPCPTLRLLALPYADHPAFREEWRP